MSIKLRSIKTGTPHISNPKLTYSKYIGQMIMDVCIKKSDIGCSNKNEIMGALERRGKDHFYEITRRSSTDNLEERIFFKIRLNNSLLGTVKLKHIEEGRADLQDAMQNTVDDVFGVGCVEAV